MNEEGKNLEFEKGLGGENFKREEVLVQIPQSNFLFEGINLIGSGLFSQLKKTGPEVEIFSRNRNRLLF